MRFLGGLTRNMQGVGVKECLKGMLHIWQSERDLGGEEKRQREEGKKCSRGTLRQADRGVTGS